MSKSTPEWIVVGVGLSVVVLVVVASVLVALLLRRNPKKLAKELAAKMGLEPLNPNGGWKTPNWFGGVRDGRGFGVTFVNVMEYSGSSVKQATLCLTVAVEVLCDGPLPQSATDGDKDRAFGKKLDLPEKAKVAADEFRKRHGSLRLGNRGGRNLSDKVLPPELFPKRPVVVMVHQPGSAQDPEQVFTLVDELSALASTLEDDQEAG